MGNEMPIDIDALLQPGVAVENNFDTSDEFNERVEHPFRNKQKVDTHALMIKTNFFDAAFQASLERREKQLENLFVKKELEAKP